MGIAKGPQILSLFFVALAPVSSVWAQQSDGRKSIARKKRDLQGRVRGGAGGCGQLQAMTCQVKATTAEYINRQDIVTTALPGR